MFTFTTIDSDKARTIDNVEYGKFKKEVYNAAYVNDIMEWLLDEDAVATEYQPLINIRAQHAHA